MIAVFIVSVTIMAFITCATAYIPFPFLSIAWSDKYHASFITSPALLLGLHIFSPLSFVISHLFSIGSYIGIILVDI